MIATLVYVVIAIVLTVAFTVAEIWFDAPRAWTGAGAWMIVQRPVIISIGTLLGFLSKSFADQLLKQRSKEVQVRTLFSAALRSRSFWGSLIVAPLVLLLFYKSLNEVTSASLILLLAYENAFFFRSFVDHAGRLVAED